MMKIHIIAVGSLKEKYLKDACAEYIKRLSAFAKVTVTEVSEQYCSPHPSDADMEQVKAKEGERILAKIPKGAYVIPLCIEGREMSSEEFSAQIDAAALQGVSDITFLIGGSFGLSNAVKDCGRLQLSFGKMTRPHQLMRVVLLEQIYRVFSISNNTKYHK